LNAVLRTGRTLPSGKRVLHWTSKGAIVRCEATASEITRNSCDRLLWRRGKNLSWTAAGLHRLRRWHCVLWQLWKLARDSAQDLRVAL